MFALMEGVKNPIGMAVHFISKTWCVKNFCEREITCMHDTYGSTVIPIYFRY